MAIGHGANAPAGSCIAGMPARKARAVTRHGTTPVEAAAKRRFARAVRPRPASTATRCAAWSDPAGMADTRKKGVNQRFAPLAPTIKPGRNANANGSSQNAAALEPSTPIGIFSAGARLR
jgi:hypothetical protein